MNQAIIIGNLTKDVEKSTTPNGISVAKFTVAVSRKFKSANGEKEVDYIPVVVWRDLADLCAKYLSKGKKVAITGAIQTRSYEVDGGKRYVTEIIADNVEFLSPTEKEQKKTIEDLPPIDDDDLPF